MRCFEQQLQHFDTNKLDNYGLFEAILAHNIATKAMYTSYYIPVQRKPHLFG